MEITFLLEIRLGLYEGVIEYKVDMAVVCLEQRLRLLIVDIICNKRGGEYNIVHMYIEYKYMIHYIQIYILDN